jgi:cytoskeletal protein RodZ
MFEIGSSLREARLRQGLDLVDAEQGTKIRSKYLRALEDERFELLPAQTYVKGFLRSYADFLGLEGQLYVDEYNSRYVTGEDELAPRTRRATSSTTHRRVETSALLFALAGIATAAALVVIAWRFGGEDSARVENLAPASAPVTREQAPDAQTAVGRWIKVDIRATRGNSSLVVHRRNRLLFDDVLVPGQRRTFTGPRLRIEVSNPENLVVRWNGEPQQLGLRAAPAVLVATRRGIAPAAAR